MPDFPKVAVRVTRRPAGLAAELRAVPDADAATAAGAEGFTVLALPPEVFHEFPKMLYHTEGEQRIVANQDEQDALGAEWHEEPLGPPEVEPPPPSPPPTEEPEPPA